MSDARAASPAALRWDIFCQVIDNLGDLGLCWRLSLDLARRGHSVRLWVDQPDALQWMAPGLHPGVELRPWRRDLIGGAVHPQELGDAVVAAFSCELDESALALIGARAKAGRPCAWFNLEYLSAESFSERAHGKAAPVLRGPAAGAPRLAFYPGFTPATGGLLREPDLPAQQAGFDRAAWLAHHGVQWEGQALLSMFCYEPALLPALLAQLAQGECETVMLVCAGRAAQTVRDALPGGIIPSGAPPNLPVRHAKLTLHFLPSLPQTDYDRLLWSCDLNFVRGEDSLVRAIWAGRAFVWQTYPQRDGAHRAKLSALLDCMQAPDSLRRFSERWNGLDDAPVGATAPCNPLPDLTAWAVAVSTWRNSLLKQPDLATQLIALAGARR